MHANDDYQHGTSDLDCIVCGHERLTDGVSDTVTCPNCQETYTLVVREGFVLVETDGWTTQVTFDVPGEAVRDGRDR